MSRNNLVCEGVYSSMSETVLDKSLEDNRKNHYENTKFKPPESCGDEGANRFSKSLDDDCSNCTSTLDCSYHHSNSEINLKAVSNGNSGQQKSTVMNRINRSLKTLELHPFFYTLLLYTLLPVWIWLTFYVLVGQENLPGGSVFVVVILGCVGRLLGFGVELLRLPPMIGMLGLGLAIRNVPYIDFGKHLNTDWSSPIRQTALAVILTRAGLNLDLDVLIRLKAIILRLAFFPTIFEAVGVAVAAKLILDFPWAWGLLLGFVLAPVSPAVVVPRLLHLRENGYGVQKGIPTIIIAAASLDNIVAISLFGVTLGFALSSSSLTYSILQGPLQIIIGLSFGFIWGGFLGIAFGLAQKDNRDDLLVRALLTFGGGLISVIGFSKLGFAGAGALGCLLASFVASCIWRHRGVITAPDPLIWVFAKLWFVFEPLLFGVIGSQIDILTLNIRTVYLGLACICVGSVVRFVMSFLMVTSANLNLKEKLFAAICWIPKATVQAAIGPVALEVARSQHKGQEAEDLGQTVLTLAVLVILLTAAIGELGVMITGKKFLTKLSPQAEVSIRV